LIPLWLNKIEVEDEEPREDMSRTRVPGTNLPPSRSSCIFTSTPPNLFVMCRFFLPHLEFRLLPTQQQTPSCQTSDVPNATRLLPSVAPQPANSVQSAKLQCNAVGTARSTTGRCSRISALNRPTRTLAQAQAQSTGTGTGTANATHSSTYSAPRLNDLK
jgi:hypothetical protein